MIPRPALAQWQAGIFGSRRSELTSPCMSPSLRRTAPPFRLSTRRPWRGGRDNGAPGIRAHYTRIFTAPSCSIRRP